MNEELSLTFNEKGIVSLGRGWEFSPLGWVVGEESEASYRSAFRYQATFAKGCAWGWGDLIVRFCEFRKKSRGEELQYVHYATEWEEMTGCSAGTLVNYCKVARAFKVACRHATLFWSHHAELYHAGVTDEPEAQDWLSKAAENRWSATTLRAQLKKAKAVGAGDGGQPVVVTQSELFAAKRWARVQEKRVPDMDEAEAQAMLADLTPILRLATALANRLGMASLPSPAPTGTPGAKESLPAAS